ncbi:MAG: Asp-tRNA(Asn)/Glu-tRNA(Gln) amidotransferase subunit GatA [Thermodesulfobacteriota bacterium]
MPQKLNELTIAEARRRLQSGEISSVQLTRAVLDRIREVDDRVGAYITVAAESALEQARAADERIARGDASPLTGIPLSIKDIICTRGLRTTCASRMLSEFVPQYDATVMEKLKGAGAVIVGKTNMDEFGMGSSTEHSAFRITRNPWDLSRIPGGSSGGSAAAVAADMCLGSLGSDTGGSIRQPASHCGVVGLKPTYGRISRFGLVAFASSLDQIGILTKSVPDCGLLLQSIAGHDPGDSTSAPAPVPDYGAAFVEGLEGVTIGLCREYLSTEGVDPDVTAAVTAAVRQLESLGARCVEVSLPHVEYAIAAYYVLSPAEASSNLARYDGVKYGFREKSADNLLQMYKTTRSRGFGREVQRRILIGTYCLSAGYYDAYYKKACQVRSLIADDFKKAFSRCDVMVSPVAPTPAFSIGSKTDDPLTMYLSDVFTLSTNLAGVPGMSVPCGFSRQGLPIGLQLTGGYFAEGTLMRVAWNFERAAGIRDRKPEI